MPLRGMAARYQQRRPVHWTGGFRVQEFVGFRNGVSPDIPNCVPCEVSERRLDTAEE